MQALVGKGEAEWVRIAWTWIHSRMAPGERVFVPAGGTPTSIYRRLGAEPTPLWRSLRLVQLDEVIGGPKAGIFRRFFEAELAPFVSQMEWIGGGEGGPATAAILGVGLNGHVAFHEPGIARNFTVGCVRLSRETLNHLDLPDPTWGLTYGAGTFLQAEKILVLAQGPAKRGVLMRALAGEDLPITWILGHPDVTVVTDFDL